MANKNQFYKNLVKARPAYRLKDNVLKIDSRIDSYDYEIQSDISCIYTFDNDFNLIFASSLLSTVGKIPLQDVFPSDMQDFFHEILEETRIKGVTKYHVQLNGRHIMYTSYTVTDQSNNTICLTLAELPFRNVQSISVIAPKIKKTFDNNKIHISYIVNRNGDIFGSEAKSINSHFLNDESNGIVTDGCNMYEVLACDTIKSKWKDILSNINSHGKQIISFIIYTDNAEYLQKTLVTITGMKMLGNDDESLSLINTEIKNQKDFDIPQDYLKKKVINDKNIKSSISVYDVCNCCKKIKLIIKSNPIIDISKYVLNYTDTISPLNDDELNIPHFGKRSKNGKISYKDNKESLWFTPQMLSTYSNTLLRLDRNYSIYYTLCNLCNDEFRHYVQNLGHNLYK